MQIPRRQLLSTCGTVAAFAGGRGFDESATQVTTPSPWRSLFPALQQSVNDRELAYLDSAATTLRLQAVIDALVTFYSTMIDGGNRLDSTQ